MYLDKRVIVVRWVQVDLKAPRALKEMMARRERKVSPVLQELALKVNQAPQDCQDQLDPRVRKVIKA